MDTVKTVLGFGLITFSFPTAFILEAGLLHAPASLIVLAASIGRSFSRRFAPYSMPLLALYVAFPFSLAAAIVVTLPIILLPGGMLFLPEGQVSQDLERVAPYFAMAITSLAFFLAWLFLGRKICARAWDWCIAGWPNGLCEPSARFLAMHWVASSRSRGSVRNAKPDGLSNNPAPEPGTRPNRTRTPPLHEGSDIIQLASSTSESRFGQP